MSENSAQHPMSAELRTISTQAKSLWPASAPVIAKAADALDALQAEKDALQKWCDALADIAAQIDGYLGGWREMIAELDDYVGPSATGKAMYAALNQIDRIKPDLRAIVNTERAHREEDGS